MPDVGGRDPKWAPGLTLVVRVEDVVVGLVGLLDAGVGVGGRAVLRAEAPDVHLPQIEARLAFGDPLRHHLADAARARQSVGAEAGADEEARHLGLPQAELVVRSEALRAVDQAHDPDLVHHRDAALRVLGDLREPVPVVLEQAAVEVGGDLVEARGAVRQERRLALPLVAAHHQALALLAEVDEEIRIAKRRQGVLAALAEWLRDQVLV